MKLTFCCFPIFNNLNDFSANIYGTAEIQQQQYQQQQQPQYSQSYGKFLILKIIFNWNLTYFAYWQSGIIFIHFRNNYLKIIFSFTPICFY